MKKHKDKGSITIFLAAILLPCLLLVSFLVDRASVMLGKAITSNALEMSVNAGLADYDVVLKEVYGLFALDQSDEAVRSGDISEKVHRYFKNTLTSDSFMTGALIAEGSLVSRQQYIVMKEEETNFVAKGNTVKTLADPAIIKGQIVDYTSLRAAGTRNNDLDSSISLINALKLRQESISSIINREKIESDLLSQFNGKEGNTLKLYYDSLKYFDTSVQELIKTADAYMDGSASEGKLLTAAKTALEDYKYAKAYSASVVMLYNGYTKDTEKYADVYKKLNYEFTIDELNATNEQLQKIGAYVEMIFNAVSAPEDNTAVRTELKTKLAAEQYGSTKDAYLKTLSSSLVLKDAEDGSEIKIGPAPFMIFYPAVSRQYVNEGVSYQEIMIDFFDIVQTFLNTGRKQHVDITYPLVNDYTVQYKAPTSLGERVDATAYAPDVTSFTFEEGFYCILRLFDALLKYQDKKLDYNIEELQADLWVVEYIFNNFSHYYESYVEDGSRLTYSGLRISSENNVAYGAETEYIIYGLTGLWGGTVKIDEESNVQNAIYQMFNYRFMSNAVYAFSSSTVKAMAYPYAMKLSEISDKKLSYESAENMFVLLLAMQESLIDMIHIENGETVAMVKNADTWTTDDAILKQIMQTDFKKKLYFDPSEDGKGVTATLARFLDGDYVRTPEELVDLRQSFEASFYASLGRISSEFLNGFLVAYTENTLNELNKTYIDGHSIFFNCTEEEKSRFINALKESTLASINYTSSEEILQNCNAIVDEYAVKLTEELIKQYPVKSNKSSPDMPGASYYDLTAVSDTAREIFFKMFDDDVCIKVKEDMAKNLKGATDNILEDFKLLGPLIDGTAEGVNEKRRAELQRELNHMISEKAAALMDEFFAYGSEKSEETQSYMRLVGYETYLKMMVLSELAGNSEAAYTRLADLIWLNLAYGMNDNTNSFTTRHALGTDFSFSKAYTEIEVSASVRVYPRFFRSKVQYYTIKQKLSGGY